MPLPVVYHENYVCPLPEGHRFPMPKFRLLYEILMKDEVISESSVSRPEIIPAEKIHLAHSPYYITSFVKGTLERQEIRRTGLPWSEQLVTRTLTALSGSVLSAEIALKKGICCNVAGGTHHAHYDFGSGFCIVNDLAVAPLCLLHDGRVSRVLIIDLDVHQGDGTARILDGHDRIFTFSLHCKENFPFQKAKSSLDIELPEGTGDEDYMKVIYEVIPGLLEDYKPDFVFYDAGVDPYMHDPLGRLNLSLEGLYQRDLFVLKEITSRGIPVSCVIGGGYSKDLNELAYRHSLVFRAARLISEQ